MNPLPIPLAASALGRTSGKSWKARKLATVYINDSLIQFISRLTLCSRSQMSDGLKSKSWEERMEQTKKASAVKKLQTELKEEKDAEKRRSVNSWRI